MGFISLGNRMLIQFTNKYAFLNVIVSEEEGEKYMDEICDTQFNGYSISFTDAPSYTKYANDFDYMFYIVEKIDTFEDLSDLLKAFNEYILSFLEE
jgi:hypothetical protein